MFLKLRDVAKHNKVHGKNHFLDLSETFKSYQKAQNECSKLVKNDSFAKIRYISETKNESNYSIKCRIFYIYI